MNELITYFEQGIIFQTYYAEYNYQIWKYIANEYDFLITQPDDVQKMYAFIQSSSVTNFTLSFSRLFDKKDNKYPTMCLKSFLEKFELYFCENLSYFEVNIEIRLLQNELINMSKGNQIEQYKDGIEGVRDYILSILKYYKQLIVNKENLLLIEKVRFIRDKQIAHNELVLNKEDIQRIDHSGINELLKVANEIVSVFSLIIKQASYKLKEQAETDTCFILNNIESIKR